MFKDIQNNSIIRMFCTFAVLIPISWWSGWPGGGAGRSLLCPTVVCVARPGRAARHPFQLSVQVTAGREGGAVTDCWPAMSQWGGRWYAWGDGDTLLAANKTQLLQRFCNNIIKMSTKYLLLFLYNLLAGEFFVQTLGKSNFLFFQRIQ